MAQRPAHSVILVSSQRVDRVDLGPAPALEVLAQNHQASQGHEDLVARVESALAVLPKVGKQVWVLWEGASSQILDMPAGVVEGLDAEQLGDALSFEAETLTGLSAAHSAIHGVVQPSVPGALHDFRRYWITQISASLRDKLQEVVARSNSRLAGIAHPGGLPRENWNEEAPLARHDWRRIEVWDQITFALQGRANGSVETRVIRYSPRSESWSAELPTDGPLSWLGLYPRERQRSGPADSNAGTSDQPLRIELPADAAPVQWLREWAAELMAQEARVPAIRPPSNISPYRRLYLSGGVAAAVILLICLSHAQWLLGRTAAAKTKADRSEALRTQLFATADAGNKKDEDAINAQIQKLQTQIREVGQQETALAGEFEKAKKVADKLSQHKTAMAQTLSTHRPAMAALLGALADSEHDDDPSEVVVKEVRQQSTGELRLSGLCRQSAFADSFASKLQTQLASAGWKVGPAQKRMREDLLAFDFAIVLRGASRHAIDRRDGIVKSAIKVSSRERLILSVAPSLVILGIYFFFIVGDLSASLDRETKRAAAASEPVVPPSASPTLAKARSALAESKRNLSDAQARIEDLRNRIAALPRAVDQIDDGRTIAKVEEVFARNGIVPVISEAATETASANHVSPTLLSILSPQPEGDAPAPGKQPHVWHYIFDDLTPHFQHALDEATREVPTALPLSLNLVYNPATRGQTRLLELWLLY